MIAPGWVAWCWRWLSRLPVLMLLCLVRAYQLTVSPILGPVCRFYPSCSQYGLGALRAHGAARGTALIAWRLARCNPWNPGGVDLVPPARGSATSDHSAHMAVTHDGAPDRPVRAA